MPITSSRRRFSPLASAAAVAEPEPANVLPLPPPIAAPVADVKPSPIKKIAFAKAPAKKDDTSGKYPVFDKNNAQVAVIAARIKQRQEKMDALDGAQKTDKAELHMFVGPFYFQTNHGRHEIPSSVSVPYPAGQDEDTGIDYDAGEVLVTYQNRYGKLESEDPLVPIIGEGLTAKFFRQSFELNISGELLPEGKEQAIVDQITAVLEEFNALEALDVAACIKPTKDFHTARHSKLTVDQNLLVQEVCPIVAQVKTKGRK